MRGEYFYGHDSPVRRRNSKGVRPVERRGVPTTGRIVKLLVGQGQGFIRLASDREVFFHRSDVQRGTSFNDFVVGDVVVFELLNDAVSGARALLVRHQSALGTGS
jgi:cold shock CspA family protein